jgi:tellurite resistance protein
MEGMRAQCTSEQGRVKQTEGAGLPSEQALPSYAGLSLRPEDNMALSVQDALIHIMVVTASSDEGISQNELDAIADQIVRSPVFDGFDMDRLSKVANEAVDITNSAGLEGVLDAAVAAIPERLHDTAYALAVEIAVLDVQLPQEELVLLEMVRDRLKVNSLVTGAIEASARARMRKA